MKDKILNKSFHMIYDDSKQNDSLKNNTVKMPKITIFLNGILIKNTFYDFKTSLGKSLLEMLSKNEFDKEVFENEFGDSQKMVDLLIERRDENYHSRMNMSPLKLNIDENCKRRKINENFIDEKKYKFVIGKGKILLPNDNQEAICNTNCDNSFDNNCNIDRLNKTIINDPIIIGENPTVKFKLLYKNTERSFLVNSNLKIADLYRFFDKKVCFCIYGEIPDENENISVLKNSMVDVFDMT